MPQKKFFAARLLSTLLLSALVLNTATFSDARAQEAQRDRRVNPPAPATSAPPVIVTPTPQPTPALPAPRTVEVLRARITDVLSQPALAPAMFGIKVVSLDTGRVLFEENARKLMMPASNMKLYTVAAALARLGPDFRFKTSVYAQEPPDKKGKLRGDLIIYGRGDPTFATRFNGAGNTDYFKAINELAARIVAAGVRTVNGDIVGDESYFTGPPRGMGWEWDDLQWYYGADVSALTVNDNALDLYIKPGARSGDAGLVTTGPASPVIRIIVPRNNEAMADAPNFLTFVNRVKTAPRGTKRDISVHRPLGQSVVEVGGQIAEDDPGYTGSVSVQRPALLFTSMLRAALEMQGVTVKGRARVIEAPLRPQAVVAAAGIVNNTPYPTEIASRESPPFSEIAAHTLKPSQNLYTELILRTLGKQFPATDPTRTSAEAGTSVVRAFLYEAGVVNAGQLSLMDGSGLARQNLITAEATVQLLTYMSKHAHAAVYRDAQPVAGVDGTLRTRLRGTAAAGNLRAKTGTLSNVSGLSGYVTTAAGERLVFSMLVNHYPEDQPPRQNYMDAIALLLASFAGKSE